MPENTATQPDPGGMAKSFTVPLVAGDGVGIELAEAAAACLDAINSAMGTRVTLAEFPIGYAAYKTTGNALPDKTVEAMRCSPATLLGAISTRECPAPSPTGQMRKLLNLSTDIRRCVSGPGSLRAGVDVIIVRECSEGFLADRNMFQGSGEFMPTPDMALSVRVITREKCNQIAKFAFTYARKEGRKKISIAHKNTVFPMGCGLFVECVKEQSRNFPEITLEEEFVDVMAGSLVSNPEGYDVIVTTNLFGDILADVAAAQVGLTNPIINVGQGSAVFYACDGPFNNLAGRQKVNPTGMMRAVSAMLRWLDMHAASRALDQAISASPYAAASQSFVLPEGISTAQVTAAVAERIRAATN